MAFLTPSPLVNRCLHGAQRVYHWVRRPLTVGVRGVIRDEEGRALLVRHTYRQGWFFPGGGVDRSEPVDAALRRELFEEVGVTFEGVPVLLGVYSNFHDFKSDHVVLFEVRNWSQIPNPRASLEIAEFSFFAPDALPGDTSPGTRRRLAELAGDAAPSFRW